MMRLGLIFVICAGLFGCGDAEGSGGAGGDDGAGGSAASGGDTIAAAGDYVGDLSVQTNIAESSIFASLEIEIGDDGSISGVITTKAPTATVGEVGELSGAMSQTDIASYQADLVLELDTLGTFTAAGTLTYGQDSRQVAGQLSARDEQGELVGSTFIAVHQE